MVASWISAVALSLGVAASGGPDWESDYGKALERSKQDARPLLVVIDNPAQEAQAVDQKLMGAKSAPGVLKKYDLCHVDATTKYGKKVAQAFHAETFPHVAIIDKSGSVILHTHVGKVTDASWKSALERHQSGVRAHTVMKPVASSVSFQTPPTGAPATSFESPTFQAPSISMPVAQPYMNNSYCPNCQKGY